MPPAPRMPWWGTVEASVARRFARRTMTRALLAYAMAPLAEIAGCFAFWAWLRLDRSAWWLLPGLASLALFAWLLALVPSPFAGRAYAAYGDVYIAASVLRLWVVKRARPDHWDLLGATLAALGVGIILAAPRAP